MRNAYLAAACALVSLSTACMYSEAPDRAASAAEQALLPNGGTVHLAVVPYYYTDSDGTQMPRYTGSPGWTLQELAFTGTGTDGATGSVKGFWNAVSGGRIAVEGVVYPWIPVVTRSATRFDQRALWRPMDDWYIPPDHQVPDFDCGQFSWGATPGTKNRTADLTTDPAFSNLYLCPDPESTDSAHFWGLDGNGAYTASSKCPTSGFAQRPVAGSYYCIHRGLASIDNVNHAWALAGANRLPPAIDHDGNNVTAPYDPADWNFDQYVTLYGYPTTNAGNAANARQVYVALAKSSRDYALYNGIHETGHALGLKHASSLKCTNPLGTIVPFDRVSGGCSVTQEYGPHNFMGGDSREVGDGYELLAVGAIAPSNLTTVTTSGSYPLPALASSPKVLRVRTSPAASSYFYLDHRAPVVNTFDASIPSAFTGIEVKFAPDYAAEQARCGTQSNCTSAQLLDMHPETPGNFDDAVLRSGQSFTDRPGRITMQATLGSAPYVDVSFTPNTTKLITTTIGGGSGATHRQSDTGLATIQNVAGFSAWTILAGTNNSGVLFYNAGAMWKAYLDGNGMFQSQGSVSGTSANVAGWTQITPVGRNNLLFYNATTGAYLVAAMGDSASSFTVKSSGPAWSSGWTVVRGALNGSVIRYRSSDGRLERGSIDGNGSFVLTGTYAPIAAGFTRGAAVREDAFALYNDATGAVQIVQIDDARTVVLQGSLNVMAGFSDVVGGMAGHLVFYRASDGATHLVNVDANYLPALLGMVPGPGANLRIASAGGDVVGSLPPLPIPPTPLLHTDFTGCDFGAPTFVVDWSAVGATPVQSFDVDLKVGTSPWEPWYNGLDDSKLLNGISNHTDIVRVRACNALGCSSFRQASVNVDCGGNDPPNTP